MTTDHKENQRGVGAGRVVTRLALALALAIPAAGCDILDVENPNNLVQEDVEQREAANAAVNGALSTLSRGIAYMSGPYSTVTDELTWIGSRDAWNQLDGGNLTDPANEFVDGAYPYFNEGRWMADEAIRLLEGHVSEDPTPALRSDLARAYLYGGVIYTAVGDIMEDFTIGDRQETNPPIGPGNMGTMYDQAITYLTEAMSIAQADGLTQTGLRAQAMRARAKHAKAVWQSIQGSVPGDPAVGAGADDAAAVVASLGFEDWTWDLRFTTVNFEGDIESTSASHQVNERGELNLAPTFASLTVEDAIDELVFTDPLTGEVDSRFVAESEQFLASGDLYPITQVSNREMHLILAEAELAAGNMNGFITHINHVRVNITGVAEYEGAGQLDPLEMLEHERQANLWLQNRRLADMYRFGTHAPEWQSSSPAATTPGTMLPIGVTEIRSNPHLGG